MKRKIDDIEKEARRIVEISHGKLLIPELDLDLEDIEAGF